MDVRHPIAAWVVDTFDLPIRALYCRAGPLSALLQRAFFARFKSSDPAFLDRTFDEMRDICREEGIGFRGSRVLELGPGNSRLNALRFLLEGAEQVTLVDRFPRSLPGSAQAAFFRRELEHLREHRHVGELPLAPDDRIDPARCREIDADLRSLDLRGLDFVYSVDVLEHVREYPSVIEKTFDLLRPGGHAFHVIDLRDHYNFARPFLFYKYSPETWDRYVTREGWSYWNRARYGELALQFRKAGFQLVREHLTRLPMRERRVSEVFRGRDDLDVAQARVLLRRPEAP